MSSDDTQRETEKPDAGTLEYPTSAAATVETEVAADDLSFDEDDEWAVRGPAKGVRLTLPIAVLVAVVLVAAGFWGGAVAQQSHGSSATGSGGSGGAAGFAARFRAGGGAAGAGSFFGGGGGAAGAAGPAASGTISVVNGNTLYILTSAGALVKATLGPSTTITRTASTTAVGLRPGDSVSVQGSTSKNGDVTATSIAATGP
jgi:hypothetical protein